MAGVSLRGGKWRIWYYDRHGKRKWGKRVDGEKRDAVNLAREIEHEERRIREGLVEAGVRERQAAAGAKPDYLIELWRESIINNGATEKHARHQAKAVGRVLEMARVASVNSVDPDAVGAAIKAIRDTQSIRTGNHALGATKQFFRWLYATDRIKEVPRAFAKLKRTTEAAGRKRVRRAIGAEEAERLYAAARSGEPIYVFGPTKSKVHRLPITGPEREFLYRVAMGTGFRVGEMRSLRRESFDLSDVANATVVVKAAYTKNKKEARQPIARSLAEFLKAWFDAGNPVPSMPGRPADMLRRDLAAAGIPYENEAGVFDFHSTRHSYITAIVQSGASVATAQRLARHSTPDLTIGRYTHVNADDMRGAIEESAGNRHRNTSGGGNES